LCFCGSVAIFFLRLASGCSPAARLICFKAWRSVEACIGLCLARQWCVASLFLWKCFCLGFLPCSKIVYQAVFDFFSENSSASHCSSGEKLSVWAFMSAQ
jgi:hypothetical protein